MPAVTVTASMPAELAEAMHVHARKADRSFSAEMRVAIRTHLGLPATSESAPTGAPAQHGEAPPHDPV